MEIKLSDLEFAFGLEPEDAVEYFRKLGLKISDNWRDTLAAIMEDAFSIAGVKNMDHLIDAKNLILEAMSRGDDLKEFKQQFKENFKLRSWHADLVVTQNISNSYNAGRYLQQIDNPEDFQFLRPIVLEDKKTTNICKWLAKQKIVVRVDDKLLKNVYSPRHFHCRTIWVAINDKMRKLLGLKVKNIAEIPPQYWNAEGFRRLPTDKYEPDFKKYPKNLIDKFKSRKR
jgi:uncharacterized protein with gpF-like domain